MVPAFPVSSEHMTMPFAFVVSFPELVSVGHSVRLAILNPPVLTTMPLENVELADVDVILSTVASIPWRLVEVPVRVLTSPPPVMVSPEEERERPVACIAWRLVLVPATALVMPPAVVRVRPPVVRMPVVSILLNLVDVPEVVLVSPPPVMVRPLVASERPAAEMLPESTVEVPETVDRMLPPVMVSPFEDAKLNAEIPPANVEVAVVVAMMPGTVDVP